MAYRTSAKTAERKEARRLSILDAATRLFGRNGYHATTVPMIVAEAGTSTGNFYFYFRNKEDVFAAALSRLGERMSSAVEAAINQAPRNTPAQMKSAIEGFVFFLAEHPEQARILIVESSGLSPRLEQIRRSVIARHCRGVEKAVRALGGNISAGDAAVTARCWTGAVHEAVYSWLELPPEQRPPATQVAAAVAAFNLRGVGAASEPG